VWIVLIVLIFLYSIDEMCNLFLNAYLRPYLYATIISYKYYEEPDDGFKV